jgi:hypothetical protein
MPEVEQPQTGLGILEGSLGPLAREEDASTTYTPTFWPTHQRSSLPLRATRGLGAAGCYEHAGRSTRV